MFLTWADPGPRILARVRTALTTACRSLPKLEAPGLGSDHCRSLLLTARTSAEPRGPPSGDLFRWRISVERLGRWPRTPYIHMVGSLFGTMSWAQVAWLLFAGGYFATGIPTTGVAVYGLLALADLLSIFRAAFDARYHHP